MNVINNLIAMLTIAQLWSRCNNVAFIFITYKRKNTLYILVGLLADSVGLILL